MQKYFELFRYAYGIFEKERGDAVRMRAYYEKRMATATKALDEAEDEDEEKRLLGEIKEAEDDAAREVEHLRKAEAVLQKLDAWFDAMVEQSAVIPKVAE